MAGVAEEDIGLIVVATTTTTHAFPSAACLVQQMLGIKDCAAFDLAAACAGFTYALSVADQYVKTVRSNMRWLSARTSCRARWILKIAAPSFCLAMAQGRWCWGF